MFFVIPENKSPSLFFLRFGCLSFLYREKAQERQKESMTTYCNEQCFEMIHSVFLICYTMM